MGGFGVDVQVLFLLIVCQLARIVVVEGREDVVHGVITPEQRGVFGGIDVDGLALAVVFHRDGDGRDLGAHGTSFVVDGVGTSERA